MDGLVDVGVVGAIDVNDRGGALVEAEGGVVDSQAAAWHLQLEPANRYITSMSFSRST